MGVKASASITLSSVVDIEDARRYYKLQESTLPKPEKPTSNPPEGWTETEPSYTNGSTSCLYFCDLTLFSDGSFSYSEVSLSSSYEAAKEAYKTASSADAKAGEAASAAAAANSTADTAMADASVAQQGVDSNVSDIRNLNGLLTDEIEARKSFMRFSEESSDPTLTLGQTDSPAQVKLTNKQLQFLYLNSIVAYMSGDALLINNARILQQLQLGGFAFVPRDNGNLAFKWVGGDS